MVRKMRCRYRGATDGESEKVTSDYKRKAEYAPPRKESIY